MAGPKTKFGKFVKGIDGQGAIDGVMSSVSAVAKISDNISQAKKLDNRGNSMGEVDVLGNTLSATSSGAQLGSAVGGPLGGAIGAGVGFLGGLVSSLTVKKPSYGSRLAKENEYQLGLHTNAIAQEDTFAKQQLMAKNGMNVNGDSKTIEVERDEIVLRKIGGAFKKVADFKGGNTHNQGGEQYKASPGDIIIPRDKAPKIERLLKARKWSAIESERLKLPSDVGQVYAKDGMNVGDPDPKKGTWIQQSIKAMKQVYPNLSLTAIKNMLSNIAVETGNGKASVEKPLKWKNLHSRDDLKSIKSRVLSYMAKNNLSEAEFDALPAADRISIQYRGDVGFGLSGGLGALQTTALNDKKVETMRKIGKELGLDDDTSIRDFVSENMYNSTLFSLKVLEEEGISEEKLNATENALELRKKYINPGESDPKKLDSLTQKENFITKNTPSIEREVQVIDSTIPKNGTPPSELSKPKGPTPNKTWWENINLEGGGESMTKKPNNSSFDDLEEDDSENDFPVVKHDFDAGLGKRKETKNIIIHRTAGGGKFNIKDPRLAEEKIGAQAWIEKDGTLHVIGDPDAVLYQSTGGWNENSIGIEIVGKHLGGKETKVNGKTVYEFPDKVGQWEPLTPEQEKTLKQYTGQLMVRYKLPPTAIKGHYDYKGSKRTEGEGITAANMLKEYFKDTTVKDNVVTFSKDVNINPNMDFGLNLTSEDKKQFPTTKSTIKNTVENPINSKEVPFNKDPNNDYVSPAEAIDPYSKYVKEQNKKGEIVESEEWFNQNIVAKQHEKNRGYTTLDSFSGKKLQEIDGIKRRGFDYIPDVVPKDPKNKENYNAVRDLTIEKWKKDNPGKSIPKSWQKFANTDFNDPIKRAPGGSWTDDLSKGIIDALIKPFYQSAEDALKDDYHNITDKKLRDEVLSAYDHIRSTKTNGTLLGRSFVTGADRIDTGVGAIFDGRPYDGIKSILSVLPGAGILAETKVGNEYVINPKNDVGHTIHNQLVGLSPENQEKVILETIKSKNLSKKAQDYLWHLMSNPEVFKNQSREATEDLNVALMVADAPHLLMGIGKFAMKKSGQTIPNAILESKQFIKMLKAGKISKDGHLTAKGIRYLRNSPEFIAKRLAAKHASKGSDATVKFAEDVKGIFGRRSKVGLDKAKNDELATLANEIGNNTNILQDIGTGTVESFNFFKNTWKSVKNLPNNVMKKFSDMDFKQAAQAEKELLETTSLTRQELRTMKPEELKTLLDKKTVEAFNKLDEAIKLKDKARETYTVTKTKHSKAVEELEKAKKLAEKDGGVLQKQKEEILATLEKELADNKTNLVQASELANTNWNQIQKIETWQASPDIADRFRMAMKGEAAIGRHLDNIAETDATILKLNEEQKVWKEIADADIKKLTDASLTKSKTKIDDATNIVEDAAIAKALALKNSRIAQLSENSSKLSAIKASEIGDRAPGVLKALQKHTDLLDDFKRTGRLSLETLNILRKRGETIDKYEEDILFKSEDIKEIEVDYTPPPIIEKVSEDEDGLGDDLPVTKKEDEKKVFDGKEEEKGSKIFGTIGQVADYAPAIFNIAKGLEPAEIADRNYVNPQMEQYENTSQPQLNIIDEAFNAAISNSRNMSGGLMGNYRSNIEKAWAEKINRGAQVNAQETQVATGVATRNVERSNQADQINSQIDSQADMIDMQNRGAKTNFLGAGIQGIADISAVKRRDKSAEEQQNMLLGLMYGKKNKE